MLNLSNNSIASRVNIASFKSLSGLNGRTYGRHLIRILLVVFAVTVGILFLPWTQNIRANGTLSTLRPEQRPQTVNSLIDGRIEKWFVQEGAFVSRGDTIAFISEINNKFLDPDLLERTTQQLKAKEATVSSYMEKVKSLDRQIDAMVRNRQLKIDQAKNKVQQAILKIKSDSIDLEAAKTQEQVATQQYERAESLFAEGLISKTDFENRKIKLRDAQAKLISAENKLLGSRNDLINARIELGSIDMDYTDKISKAESEKYSAMSAMYDAEAVVTKLQNEYMNYSIRKGMYYIRAPQDGYVARTLSMGIGETVKEGQPIISILPARHDLAVELYIDPMDQPLIQKGRKVRFLFDGWPSIVFSGWPNMSFGTYGGIVYNMDPYVNDQGKYRVLVVPDPEEPDWPEPLRIGAGAKGIALLDDVPVWYEMWRQLNGFPPNFYTDTDNVPQVGSSKTKAK